LQFFGDKILAKDADENDTRAFLEFCHAKFVLGSSHFTLLAWLPKWSKWLASLI